MCEYCKKGTSGKSLITFMAPCGFMGKIISDIGIQKALENGTNWFLVSTLTTPEGFKAGRCEINYCPICGRRLQED